MPAAFAVLPNPFVLDFAIRLAAPTWIANGQAVDAGDLLNSINDKLRDEDVDLSDYNDDALTDHSTDVSPASSPSSTTMKTPATGQKMFQDKTAEATEPVRPARRKRKRMSEEERKVRHREVQRQFMKRKRARIAVLRKVQSGVEKQLRLVRVLQEVEMLKREQESLKQQYEACDQSSEEPAGLSYVPEPAAPRTFGDLVFSVPTEEAHEDFLITECDWDELFDVLSDEATGVFDVDSDVASEC